MSDCPLCDPPPHGPAGDLLWESDTASVILSADWATRGHAIVAAKRHVENVSDLEASEARSFFEAFRQAESVLLHAVDGDRAIVMKLGLAVPHLHMHIYPVARFLDRGQVFEILENRRQTVEPRDRAAFVDALRERFREVSVG